MNHIDHIALSSIDRMVPYINRRMLTLSQIVAEEQPDLAFTGNFYNESTRKPVCPLKADGIVYDTDKQYSYYVHTWNDGADLTMELLPPGGSTGKKNHIANCVLIVDGTPQKKLWYNIDAAGVRGRVAMGTEPGYLDVFAASDGDTLAMTPEQLRDYAAGTLHWKTGVMHDGGRKVNYYNKASGILTEGKDPSQNLILVTLKKGTKEEKTVNKQKIVVLDAGHYSGCANGNAALGYKEDECVLDLSKRLEKLLAARGVEVHQTRTDGTCVSLAERCAVSNHLKPDLFVSLHTNANTDASCSGYGVMIYGAGGMRETAAKALTAQAKAAGIPLWGETGIHCDPNLYVLKDTDAPAVLIEHGFHTNDAECRRLLTDSYRDTLAAVDAAGICEALGVAAEKTEAGKAWYEDARQRLMAAGITDGTNPDGPVTRAQAWVMLDRAING
jgi:N-acetylmuramoyl-L-alanine amidase